VQFLLKNILHLILKRTVVTIGVFPICDENCMNFLLGIGRHFSVKKREAAPERDGFHLTNFEKNFTKSKNPTWVLSFKGCRMVTPATYGNITKSSSNPGSERGWGS